MKDTWNIFIIGPSSRKDEIQKAAMYYLDSGYYVQTMKKQSGEETCTSNNFTEQQSIIIDCLKKIDGCDKVVAIPQEDETLDIDTLYKTAYAQKIGKEVEIW